ncbi:hypothetical protein [Pararhodobacter zhoushanensis]|uniref:Uncharacterized protein n=1 Tax=Pararhodobacter zhoushanensis TaxID=2479545 RepID=A0ABT3GYS3_9RHOB|nr:hypothetical protein [Pararhodobacter zhoushanensis]MCW1932676.1 hypothetical protein [Pararhodobacter zhoushanensis]
MKTHTLLLAAALSLGALPAVAQITVTAAPEVSALMADCTPTTAQGAEIVAGLRARGWVDPDTAERRATLTTLAAAHLWSFLPDRTPEAQIELLGPLTDAVERALDGGGALLTKGDERALILWDGDSLSCLWAGPQTQAVDTLAVQLGGPLPASEGSTTRAINQRLEAGGRNWQRRMAVGRTPVTALPPVAVAQAITDAARLDRSPE